ncbi:hypothetical protein DMR38_16395 [Clostridium sp. AWRP]|nr:hypothetical protein DMR38_16395 [Clostridium sp. AWRP]
MEMVILNLCMKKREGFHICGYLVETSLKTCEKDLSNLWNDFNIKKEDLFNVFGYRNDFYGLMWSTENQKYCYLIGIEVNYIDKTPIGAYCKYIPGTNYAVAYVPPAMSAVEAWTEYYEKILPEAGYIPNSKHGMNFEYYPNGSKETYELWTPIIER